MRIRVKLEGLKRRRTKEELVNYWQSRGNSDSEESDESLSNFAHPSNFFARIRKLQKCEKVKALFAESCYFSVVRARDCTIDELFELAVKYPKAFELPDPMYRDLPPLTSIDRERRRVTESLLDQKMQNALTAFYDAMNDKAASLGMKNSNFSTSHGGIFLPDNYSTAHDIAILAGHAMKKQEFFRQVSSTKSFSVKSQVNKKYEYKWENTNSLLWDPSGSYFGVKTGITHQAGPCLCVNYKTD